jgi:hypothetical protein
VVAQAVPPTKESTSENAVSSPPVEAPEQFRQVNVMILKASRKLKYNLSGGNRRAHQALPTNADIMALIFDKDNTAVVLTRDYNPEYFRHFDCPQL